jgi:uncharacterized protein (DUF305 family)
MNFRRFRRNNRSRRGRYATVLFFGLAVALSPHLVVARAQTPNNGAAPIIQPGAPGAPSKQLPASTTGRVPSLSPADVDFMQGMIMHHSQAVEMTALIPSHTENQAIRTLGSRISRSQSDEMNFMKRWLAQRGQPISMSMPGMPDMDMHGAPMAPMPGMLTPIQMEALRLRPPFPHRHDPASQRSAHHGQAAL